MKATIASGTRHKKAPRQPTVAPGSCQRGCDDGGQRVTAVKMASARGPRRCGTSRMAVAADNDQNPPMTILMSALPSI